MPPKGLAALRGRTAIKSEPRAIRASASPAKRQVSSDAKSSVAFAASRSPTRANSARIKTESGAELLGNNVKIKSEPQDDDITPRRSPPAKRSPAKSQINTEPGMNGNGAFASGTGVAVKVEVKKEIKQEVSNDAPGRTQMKKGKRQHVEANEYQYDGPTRAAPANWEEVLSIITKARDKRDAPVDSMGAEVLPQTDLGEKVYRFQVLMSALLSSQTNDKVTSAAVRRLQAHGCTLEKLSQTPVERISELIYPVGFYPTKAKAIVKLCTMLTEEHDGDVPSDMKSLLKLPGIGPKMAHLYQNVALGMNDGICVDTHVHRISNRLGWVNTWRGGNEDDTRKELQTWMPRSHWSSINLMLVGYGQQVCFSAKPKCDECGVNQLCPSAFKTHLELSKKEAQSSPKKKPRK